MSKGSHKEEALSFFTTAVRGFPLLHCSSDEKVLLAVTEVVYKDFSYFSMSAGHTLNRCI
ncbi:hypothetical protein BABINDRAFT_161577 [Babjeviella inositovora NRRL Y-12698]|uniref:Uncharacterized protein n=1 Tax=Babjeviella inositovora NRRL Y-12698 TaxID=984486 RepID=A0A1E3QQH0_9ASCO|nr:uncharacterized protein BABINDRAFT_161577 [Babjeviella inositovora NRRL Y-12698]ODQ79910.1 hypothetical protein BABINDRAFT_161577 [Babjeviella inositovora NRRL Y-12698]